MGKIHVASKACVLLYWQPYFTALEKWASANFAAWYKEQNYGTFAHVHVRVPYMLSPVRLSVCLSVCLSSVCLSVTLVHRTQPVEIFGNVSTPFGTCGLAYYVGIGLLHWDTPIMHSLSRCIDETNNLLCECNKPYSTLDHVVNCPRIPILRAEYWKSVSTVNKKLIRRWDSELYFFTTILYM